MAETLPMKDDYLRARVPAEFKLRVTATDEEFGVSEAIMVRDGVEAVMDYIRKNKGYRRPIKVIFDEETAATKLQMVAESPTKYEKGKKKSD